MNSNVMNITDITAKTDKGYVINIDTKSWIWENDGKTDQMSK